MLRRTPASIIALSLMGGTYMGAAAPATPPASVAMRSGAVGAAANSPETPRAAIDEYCITCHNERIKAGDLVLQGIAMDHLSPRAELWEKVIRKLRVGAMPPAGLPRP